VCFPRGGILGQISSGDNGAEGRCQYHDVGMRSLDVTLPWGGGINTQELERFLGDTPHVRPVGMIYVNSDSYGRWKCFWN
jgi:hypothetical protein